MSTMTAQQRVRPAVVAAGVLACVVLGAGPVVAQDDDDTTAGQTWSVQPAGEDGADGRASWEYELEPGESVDDFAQLNNFGEQGLTFLVYSHDALNTPEGAFTLQPADVDPVDVGAWVGLDEQVTVEPGDSVVVPFTLAVPEDATPGDHAGGIVASVTSEGTDDEGSRVLVDNRVGSRIYLRVVGQVNPVLEVTQLHVGYERSWVPFTSGVVTVTYMVRNTGNVRLTGDQKFTVHGLLGLGSRTVTLEGLREILPEQVVTATAEADGVAPFVRVMGEIAVSPVPPELSEDPIPPVLATAAATVWAVPWPELVILLLVTLGVWLAWCRRRRRKRHEKTMVKEAVAQAREEMRQQPATEPTADIQPGAGTESDVVTDSAGDTASGTGPVPSSAEQVAAESETANESATATESETAASSGGSETSATSPDSESLAGLDAIPEPETKGRRPG